VRKISTAKRRNSAQRVAKAESPNYLAAATVRKAAKRSAKSRSRITNQLLYQLSYAGEGKVERLQELQR
jgi:hypothetical protein